MKQNEHFTAVYVGVSLVWCLFLVSFAFSPLAIERGGLLLIGAAFVLLAGILSFHYSWSGPLTGSAIIMSITLVGLYPILRFLASLSYDLLKQYEDVYKIALRPTGAPENFPIVNNSLVLFTALGLVYITVAFLYWLKVIRERPETPVLFSWRVYFQSFSSVTRVLFLCTPLLLILLVGYMHKAYDYRGIGSHGWGIIVIFVSYFFLYPVSPRKVRGIAAIVSLSFLILLFFNAKNYESMLFAMRSSLGITPESLGVPGSVFWTQVCA